MKDRPWLAPAVLAAVAIAAVLVLRAPPRSEPPNLVEEFARTSGFDRADVHESIPALPPRYFTTAQGAAAWQSAMRARLAEVFAHRGKPAPFPLLLDRARLPAPAGLVRERLQFDGSDGTRIPAILQYPEGVEPRPGILVIPGHVPSHDSGLRTLVWDETADNHAAATALAQRGFVTLAFELRGFGLLGMREGAEHNAIAFNALQRGTFYLAIVTDDATRALALLRSLPQVDPKRIGVSGVSIGGKIAAALAALDPTINAAALNSASGMAGTFPPRAIPDAVVVHYCQVIPGQWSFLREEDMTLLIAPRPVLVALGGGHFKRDEQFVKSADSAWRALGAPGGLELKVLEKRGYEFFVEETAEFFARAFAAR